jgi:parallel beta-helix repeat protein
MRAILVLIGFLCIVSVSATTYYVDGSNGNDSNTGLSLSTAFKTITKANTVHAGGDTVYILPGEYRESISPKAGLSNSQRTTYNGLGNRAQILILGSDNVTNWTQCNATLCPGVSTNVWFATFSNPSTRCMRMDGSNFDTSKKNTDCFEDRQNWYIPGTSENFSFWSSWNQGKINAPGEYYLDSANAKVYVWPFKSDNPNTHQIECTRRSTGSVHANTNIKNLTFMESIEQELAVGSAGVTTNNVLIQNNAFRFSSGESTCANNPGAIYYAAGINGQSVPAHQGVSIRDNLFMDMGSDRGPATNPNVEHWSHDGDGMVLYTVLNGTVENNTIYNAGTGIDLKMGEMYTVVRNNIIYNTSVAGMRLGCDSPNNTVYNNFFFNPISGSGIILGRASNYNALYHNDIYNTKNNGIELSYADCNTIGQIGTIAMDNIISSKGNEVSIELGGESSSNINYNLFDSNVKIPAFEWYGSNLLFAAWKSTSGFDINSSTANPLYANPSNGNFTLQSISPAINTGHFIPSIDCARADDNATNPYPTSDLSCRHWCGTAPDMGAIEYCGPSTACSLPYDVSPCNCINSTELNNAITGWYADSINIPQLMSVIKAWKVCSS